MRNKVAKRLRKQARVEGRPDRKYVIVSVANQKKGTLSETGCYRESFWNHQMGRMMRDPQMVALTQCDRQDYQQLKKQHKAAA